MSATHRLAVIMFTDIVGYTSLMGENESKALDILERNRKLHQSLLEEFGGKWLKEMGDGILTAFDSSTDALRCAAALIKSSRSLQISLRIGIHLGEVVFNNGDVFGDGVNIASRVQSIALPDTVFFTDKVCDDIRNKPEFRAVNMGNYQLKNVERPLTIYALHAPGLTATDQSNRSDHFARTKRRIKASQLLMIASAILLLSYLGGLLLKNDSRGATESPAGSKSSELITIAALPFSNISAEDDVDFLGFALVDEVINALSYLHHIVVRPSTSIRKYSRDVVDLEQIARTLHVDFVLMGHYLKNKDSLRLNLELIDIKDNRILWRGSMQEQFVDLFKLQDRVVQKVIDGLKVEFSGEERARMAKDIPEDPAAYESYLKGLAYPRNITGNQKAIQMFEKAIELDSSFAPAYSELGNRMYQMARYTMLGNEQEQIDSMIYVLNQALALNEDQLTTLGLLSNIYTELNQMDKALEVSQKMVAINPNNAFGHFSIGYVYRYVGLIDKAVEEMERAVRIDPHDPQFRSIGITYNLAGQYQKAIDALNYEDGSGFCEAWKGLTYIRMGEVDNARQELRKSLALDAESTLAQWSRLMLAHLDKQDIDLQQLREIQFTIEDPESIYNWGLISLMHGDTPGFVQMFDKAVEKGYYPYPAFMKDPLLETVNEDPSFNRILEKARLKHESFKGRYFIK
jgi:adenylate cyclase